MAQRIGASSTDKTQDPIALARIDDLERQISSLRHALDNIAPAPTKPKASEIPTLIGFAADPPPRNMMTAQSSQSSITATRAKLVRDYISRRKLRSDLFPSEYFADPVWDMLLDLYAAHHEERLVSVSSLCLASGVPQTTALRWIKTLTADGSLIRSRDDSDGRRVYVQLGSGMHEKLDAYFKIMEG